MSPSVSAANKIKLPFPKKFQLNSSQPWASHTAHQQGSGAGTLFPAAPFARWQLGWRRSHLYVWVVQSKETKLGSTCHRSTHIAEDIQM